MTDEELVKLKILLRHWAEHHDEHGEEYRAWAEKAGGLGAAAVKTEIISAAEALKQSSQHLARALVELEGG